jgi:16S rRNA (cytidine1402-2'-O)-methyltransferase
MSKLSVVATPIGNLEDMTLRAIRVLNECDVVLCEDTRMTKKLLDRYEIASKTMSYHAQSGEAKYDRIFDLLADGKHLALVSDAGTPTISDPGVRLLAEVRERFGSEVAIETIPGPSALTAALSIAGVPTHEFVFLGFLPHKKGRETLLSEVAETDRTVVLYESPHRLLKTLESLKSKLASNRTVTVCRELTKVHESVVQGSADEVLQHFIAHPDQVRGEIVLLVS